MYISDIEKFNTRIDVIPFFKISAGMFFKWKGIIYHLVAIGAKEVCLVTTRNSFQDPLVVKDIHDLSKVECRILTKGSALCEWEIINGALIEIMKGAD